MNFIEKVEKSLLELRLARSMLTADNLETHKRDLDAAVKEYREGEYG